MPKFNSAYFQNQILKNQIAVDVAVANENRFTNPDIGATIPSTDVSENSIFITAGVITTTTWPTSPASNDYLVDASGGFSGTKTLRKYNGSNWSATTGLTNLQGVVFSSTSNSLVAGDAYNTNGSAALTKLAAASILDCSGQVKIFDVNSSGVSTPKSAGRYFNRQATSTVLYNVDNGVTNGTYTKITNTGAYQLASSNGKYYGFNGTTWV
jgi:hypothetical protein